MVNTEIKIQELERIREENDGVLKPAIVVDESRPEEAPLHPCFEWNDDIAGEQWRLFQARNMIKNVRIIKQDKNNPGKSIKVRAYTNIDETDFTARAYYSVCDVVKNPDLRSQLVEQAWRELSAVKARYREIMTAIDEGDAPDPRLFSIGQLIIQKETEEAA